MSVIGTYYGNRAYLLHTKKQYPEAMVYYEKAFAHGNRNAGHLAGYAVLLMRMGRFPEAIDYFDKALQHKMNAENLNAVKLNRALSVFKGGDRKQGIRDMEKLYEEAPNGRIYQTLGFAYILEGDLKKALSFNLEAMEYDENDAVVLDNLATTYLALDRYDKAEPLLRRAHELRPKQVDILYHLAQVEVHRGELGEALDLLEMAEHGYLDALNDVDRDMIDQALEEVERLMDEEDQRYIQAVARGEKPPKRAAKLPATQAEAALEDDDPSLDEEEAVEPEEDDEDWDWKF